MTAPNTPQSAGASLSDILSAIKNLVQGVGTLAQNYLNVQGLTNMSVISAATVVKAAPGRVARVSVTTAGSTTGLIYDGANLQATGRPIYIIPEATGIYEVNLPAAYGILVTPGTSQVVTVSYS